MALIEIKTPEDGSTWSDDRLAFMASVSIRLPDGEVYPFVAARRDGDSAILTVDTGEGGPTLEAGTETDVGIVQ